MSKITDLIKSKGPLSFSFEITPDISEEELSVITLEPAFFSVTWHAKSHGCKNLDIAPLRTAKLLRSKNKQVLLHLSCDMLMKDYLLELLSMLQSHDICNLLVILGEKYDTNTSDFKHTADLVKFIKEKTGDYFCIGVAGHPDGSIEKLQHLKEKIQSGADFVVTQAFFESNAYEEFRKKCEEFEINVLLIPGIFLFQTTKELNNFLTSCKVKVSKGFTEFVDTKTNDDFGVEVIKKLINDISSDKNHVHFHFFTLNKIKYVCNFIENL